MTSIFTVTGRASAKRVAIRRDRMSFGRVLRLSKAGGPGLGIGFGDRRQASLLYQ
jgi:hypothetical protein